MSNAPKTMEFRFPCASRSSHLLSILPFVAAASFWLVVALIIIDRQPFKAAVYFIFYIFLSINSPPQMMGRCPPMRSLPSASPLYHPPYRFRRLSGWLLVVVIDWRPPKAKAPPSSLFFDEARLGTPINGTGNGKSATNDRRLLQDHWERRRQDIGPWRMLPWRERAKAAGG